MSKRDYYEVLGVSRGATADQIKSAYRALARKLHPDVNKAPDAGKMFAEVQEAYDALNDPKLRAAYDQFGHAGVAGGAPPPRSSARSAHAWPGGGGVELDPEDLGSMFEAFFGGRNEPRGRARGARPSRAPRAEPVEHSVRVPFATMALGGTIPLRIEHDGRANTIDVTIPRGIADGAKLRVRGAIADELGRPVDAVLRVRVDEHPLFRRAAPESLDVLADVPITLGEALFGGTARLRLLDGTIVELTIPAGSRGGQRLRLRERGIDSGSARGDLYAMLHVIPPDTASLNEAERSALRAATVRQPSPRTGPDWPE